MAITAYTGLPGSGKSYSAVAFAILPAIKAGRAVRTNIPLDLEAIRQEWPAADVEQFDLKTFEGPTAPSLCEGFPPGALIVLDEVWRLWPSGVKASAVSEDHKSFLAEHRHRVGEDGRATDIILVTQDLNQVAAFARALVDKTYISQKLDALGARSRAKINMYQGAVTGSRGPQSQHIRTSTLKYSPEVWRFYRSHTQSQTGEAGDETAADKRATIWASPFWMALGFGVFVVAPIAFWKAADAIQDPAGALDEDSPLVVKASPMPTPPPIYAAPPAAQTTPVPVPVPIEDTRPSLSNYRLVGYITRASDGAGLALIRNAVGYLRLNIDACEPMENSPDLECMHDGKRVRLTTGHSLLSGRQFTQQ